MSSRKPCPGRPEDPWDCDRCGRSCLGRPLTVILEGVSTTPNLCKSCHEIWCDKLVALFSNFMRIDLGSEEA